MKETKFKFEDLKVYLKTLDSVIDCVVCSTIAKRQNYLSNNKDFEIREKLVELSEMITSLQKISEKQT